MEEYAARMDDGGIAENLEALRNHHQNLESRLACLEGQLSWTIQEQAERARLKKEKLAVKDRIQILLARVPLR
jgi:hypothetical protein